MDQSIKYISLVFILLFILILLDNCIAKNNAEFTTSLLMVNVFSRHADRTPTDEFISGDAHLEKFFSFWPNGIGTLTDLGVYRATKFGLDLKRRYGNMLLAGTNISDSIKAFSSIRSRCIESMNYTLKGLLDQEFGNYREVLKLLNKRRGERFAGGRSEQVPIDTKSVRLQSWKDIDECKFKIPYRGNKNLLLDKEIASLPGIYELKRDLNDRFRRPLDKNISSIYSNFNNELQITRTSSTINYTSYMRPWLDERVPIKNMSLHINLFDVAEASSVLYYKNQFSGQSQLLSMGPPITSLIDTQKATLTGRTHAKLILYSTHDSNILNILKEMGIINFTGSYEERLALSREKLSRRPAAASIYPFLNGIRIPEYGSSIIFELHRVEKAYMRDNSSLAFVKLWLYNEADPKFKSIEWFPIKFGSICRKELQKLGSNLEEKYYPKEFVEHLDVEYDCPFRLVEKITEKFMLAEGEWKDLCDGIKLRSL